MCVSLISISIYHQGVDGVLVPGGFGDRGVEGKILAAKYARESKIPFLGICLGMQVAVIEFARSVLCLHDANSTEFKPETKHPCIVFMPEVLKLSATLYLKFIFVYCLPYSSCSVGLGFKNSYGWHYAVRIKKIHLQCQRQQIRQTVRTIGYVNAVDLLFFF